jgi:hypothetical protein
MPNTITMKDKLQFLELDKEARDNLRTLRDALLPELDSILDDFYAHLRSVPEISLKLDQAEAIERLKAAQKAYWLNLLNGEFDINFVTAARRVGQAYHDRGVDPSWYMGGYCFILNRMIAVLIRRYGFRPRKMLPAISALNRAVFLDMDIALGVYHDAALESFSERARRLNGLLAGAGDFQNEAIGSSSAIARPSP